MKIYLARVPLAIFNDQVDHWGLIIQNVASDPKSDDPSAGTIVTREKKDNFYTINLGVQGLFVVELDSFENAKIDMCQYTVDGDRTVGVTSYIAKLAEKFSYQIVDDNYSRERLIEALEKNLRKDVKIENDIFDSDPELEQFDKFLKLIYQNIQGKKYNIVEYNCQTLALNLL